MRLMDDGYDVVGFDRVGAPTMCPIVSSATSAPPTIAAGSWKKRTLVQGNWSGW